MGCARRVLPRSLKLGSGEGGVRPRLDDAASISLVGKRPL